MIVKTPKSPFFIGCASLFQSSKKIVRYSSKFGLEPEKRTEVSNQGGLDGIGSPFPIKDAVVSLYV